MPQVYLVGGPNGAGKTTAAFLLLRQQRLGVEFVNADLIAAQINPQKPEAAAFQAGRAMLGRLEELVASGDDFLFESTLASRSFAPFLHRCRDLGYTINLFYFWLQAPQLAVDRVALRVRLGGHNVPPDDVRRRYDRSVLNFRMLYLPLADFWYASDNTFGPSRPIAEGGRGFDTTVYDRPSWQKLLGEQHG